MGEQCLKRCVLLAVGKKQRILGDAALLKGLASCMRSFGHTSDNKEKSTLVEQLKMQFRNKSVGKSDVTKISIRDIQEIWIDTVVTQEALVTTKIELDPQIFKDMEIRLRDIFEEWSEDGMVEYEEYLPTMVDLIKPNVSRTDLLEVANELFDVYYPDYSGHPGMPHGRVWQPRPQAMLQNLKIKSCYRTLPGRSNIEIMKNIEENESHAVHANGNLFSLWEFIMKMVNVPIIRGIGG